MDPFKKFLIFWIFCILVQRSYGRKHHSYVPYYGSSKSVDLSKFVEKEMFNIYPESSVSGGRPENAQLYKIDGGKSKFQKSLPQSENKNPTTSDSTGKTIEMKVGEHLVKVRSEKEPLSSASEGSSINPKYSHVIEIIHRGDNLEKDDKLAQIYDATEGKQAIELTKTADSDGDSESDETEEEFREADEEIPEESDETEEEFSEADEERPGESDETEEEFSEADEERPEESDETEEEFSEADEEIPEESDETKEEFSEADEEVPVESDGTEEFSEADEEVPVESDGTEEFSEADEEVPVESDGTEEFIEADEEVPEESDETEEEFSEADEEVPEESDETEEEFSEADEEVPEESDETEEEFSEADEEVPEESDETEEEFSEADEEVPEESDETEEEFSEADEEVPEESDETEEEFSEPYEEVPEESDETEEAFNEVDEEIQEESDETNEEEFSESDLDISEETAIKNEEKFSEADGLPVESDEIDKEDGETDEEGFEFEAGEKIPEEIDEGIPIRFGEANEKDSDATENTKNLAEGANTTKGNKTSDEQVTVNEDFKEVFEGSGEEFADINDQSSTKTGRILGMFSRRNETFPSCTTPKGEAGHCRRLGECLLSEALNNFNGFLQQLCLIRGVLVGICCPDNPVIETLNPDENATSELPPEEIKQPPEGCGLNTKTRIVGGSISVPHEWTWMVALMRRNRFYCGGVIINNWYILTAAHCVMGMNVKDLTVRLGEYDFNEDSKHTEDLSVAEIKRHAQFVTLTFQHDIALLKLKRSIKYSKFVGSICLPEQKARDYSDVKGTVVGWGTVSFGGAASPVLRQVTVPVWKNKDCDRTYLLESIGDSFMCAGSPEKGEDACQGDSGGPLMTVTENGRWEVIGLVSWGRRCGDPTYPGVYTRVTTYLDWIKQNAV